MAHLSADYRRRVAISAVTTGASSTADVQFSPPSGWVEFWDAIDASGFGVRLTEADGVTGLTYAWNGFDKANKTGTLQIESAPTPSTADRCVLYWLYYDVDSPTDGSGAVSIASPLTARVELSAPDPRVTFPVLRQEPGALVPRDRLAKSTEDNLFLWLDYGEILTRQTQPFNGRLQWEEPSSAQALVLDGDGVEVPSMTSPSDLRWVSVREGPRDRIYLRVRLEGGTDATSYTLVAKALSDAPGGPNPYRRIKAAIGVNVRDVLEAATPGTTPVAALEILTDNTVWVDGTNGDNSTGQINRQDLPFLTIGAALSVATSGFLVRIRPGTYPESALTIPAGVVVAGDSWQTVTVGVAGALADIFTMGAGCGIQGLTVQVPSGAYSGIVHNAGTGNVFAINIAGDGATGSGVGIYKTGAGKLVGGVIRCETGGLANVFRVDSGVLALDDCHIPNSTGTIAAALLAEGTGRWQCQGWNIGNLSTTDAIQVDGSAVVLIYSPNIFNVTNAVHILADGVDLTVIGGRISATARSVWIDSGLTGTGTTVRALGTVLDPLFDFPPLAAQNTEFTVFFNQQQTNTRDALQRLIGADLGLGFPERGSGLSVGKGTPYSDGMKVVTTNGAETMVGSTVTGGNQVDVTTAAASLDSSTFALQGTALNTALYICSTRKNAAGVPLKHWGWTFNQIGAGVGGSYVVEIWNGSAWVDVGPMAVSVAEQYRYADQLFLRANSLEVVHIGILDTTPWAQATVDGVAGYWARVRVASVLSTAPSWERVRLNDSSTAFNATGQRTARGLAKWRLVLGAVGLQFSSTGVGNALVDMGSGAVAWTHLLSGANLNTVGDDVYLTLALPQGICTAHPIRIKFVYGYSAFTAVPDVQIDTQLCEVQGNRVADPSGGIAPIARTVAATQATNVTPGIRDTFTGVNMPINTIARYESIDLDASSFYEDDIIAIRITLAADGGGTDVIAYGIEVEGIQFTDGALGS